MKKRYVFLLTATLLFGGFFVWQWYGYYERTKDWKTYRNHEYGFEFKYPVKYSVKSEVLAGDNHDVVKVSTIRDGSDSIADEIFYVNIVPKEADLLYQDDTIFKLWTILDWYVVDILYVKIVQGNAFMEEDGVMKKVSLRHDEDRFNFGGDFADTLFPFVMPYFFVDSQLLQKAEISQGIFRSFHFFR